jgi:succinate dehydrogenase / fumarate reductase iron-sulfur subunit
MKIILEIQRYDPAKDPSPRLQRFEMEVEPNERLLDVLVRIKRTADPSLSLRMSCGHGICGSDALVINGTERLACKTLVREIASGDGAMVRVEPLRTMPLQRDLMVDQSRFFGDCRKVRPFEISAALKPERERLQTPEERARIDDATKCILCAACYSACPVRRRENPDFIGPAAIVQASRFVEDNRDTGFEERLPALDQPNGVWPCQNFFECTRVCPRGIKVTKLINQAKRKITAFRKSKGGS